MSFFYISLLVLAIIGLTSTIIVIVFEDSEHKNKEAIVDIFSYLAVTNLALLFVFFLIYKGSGVI